jgi:hypothetical protein
MGGAKKHQASKPTIVTNRQDLPGRANGEKRQNQEHRVQGWRRDTGPDQLDAQPLIHSQSLLRIVQTPHS